MKPFSIPLFVCLLLVFGAGARAQFLINTQVFGLTAGMNSLGKDAEFGADYEICAASSKIAGGLGIGGFIRFYGTVTDDPEFSNRLDRYTFALTGAYHPLVGKGRFDPEFGLLLGYEYWTLYKTSKFPAVSPDSSSAEPRFNAGITAGVRYWMSPWLALRLRVVMGNSFSLIGYNNILSYTAVPTAAIELGADFAIQPDEFTSVKK